MGDVGTTIWKSWPETIGIFLLVIGVIVALSIQSAWINYVVICLGGLIFGRVIFTKKGKQPLFPFFLIVIAFLIGYLIGSIMFNKVYITALFIITTIISYQFHKKGYIP